MNLINEYWGNLNRKKNLTQMVRFLFYFSKIFYASAISWTLSLMYSLCEISSSFFSMRKRSYIFCKLSQDDAGIPSASPKRAAILGVIFLLHLMISLISNLLIPTTSESSFCVRHFTLSALARYLPGWNANPGLIMIHSIKK